MFCRNLYRKWIFNEFLWKSSFLSQHYKFSQQMMIWSTKSQQTHNTSKKGFFIKATGGWVGFLSDVFSECFQNDYLNATGGWVGFFIFCFLWIFPKRLSLTSFLICLYWMTNMNAFFEGKKGLWPTGPRFLPVVR